MMKLEDIESRLKELPDIIKQLETELHQLVGYRQAIVDVEEEKKRRKKE